MIRVTLKENGLEKKIVLPVKSKTVPAVFIIRRAPAVCVPIQIDPVVMLGEEPTLLMPLVQHFNALGWVHVARALEKAESLIAGCRPRLHVTFLTLLEKSLFFMPKKHVPRLITVRALVVEKNLGDLNIAKM